MLLSRTHGKLKQGLLVLGGEIIDCTTITPERFKAIEDADKWIEWGRLQDSVQIKTHESKTNTLPIEGLNHLSYGTSDVTCMALFYMDILGFKLITRPKFPFGGAWMRLSSTTLHIISEENPVPKPNKSIPLNEVRRSQHFAFTVSDIEEVKSKLEKMKIEYSQHKVPDTHITQLFFRDPDGNGVEVGDFNHK